MRWRLSRTECVLKLTGALLMVAAVLKGYQLLTEPVVDNGIWTYRPLLILQVELELALGIWLLSGLFVKSAWLVSVACFAFFAAITLYKGFAGARSCGCFGSVHVNPWITLIVVDLPVVVALNLFRPKSLWSRRILLRIWWWHRPIRALLRQYVQPWPPWSRFVVTAVLGLAVLGGTTPILALNAPAASSPTYEVVKPTTWIGHELPILEYIDIHQQLRSDTWLVLFHHHACPECKEAVSQCQQMAQGLEGNEDFLRIAMVEVPPYGNRPASGTSSMVWGRLAPVKEWFITTPLIALLDEADVKATWEQSVPDLEAVLGELMATKEAVARLGRHESGGRSSAGRKEVMTMDDP